MEDVYGSSGSGHATVSLAMSPTFLGYWTGNPLNALKIFNVPLYVEGFILSTVRVKELNKT